MPEQGQEETVRIVALDRSFHVNCYICEVSQKPATAKMSLLELIMDLLDLWIWLCCVYPSGMRSPAVLRGGGSRLLPVGWPHPVQELQRSPHPGPLSQNLHWLLIRLPIQRSWKSTHVCSSSPCWWVAATADEHFKWLMGYWCTSHC